MGPMASRWAEAMSARGHRVEVVTAHPHYPGPLWGHRLRPYRETRNGIPVLRLPLVIGHRTTPARILEEVTYAASAAVAAALRPAPDAAVVVSPSFLGVFPVLMSARLRRFPWILWLEDILPDAAATTGLMREGLALRTARHLERYMYRSAAGIVVISNAFRENLLAKGVPPWKVTHIYNPFTRGPAERRGNNGVDPARVLYMGNMGHSQNLPALVRAFETSSALGDDARLILAGTGELALEVAAEIRSTRVQMPGLLLEELEEEMQRAAIGLVPQRPDVDEFNLPSKLMNLMSRGVPVLASVNPQSEIARIVQQSGAGWVIDASDPEAFPSALRGILADKAELDRRGQAGLEFARRNFSPEAVATRFDDLLQDLSVSAGLPREGGQ
ncbi:MAG TPA: glycosyltransferase family 4 protein [Solirubrobacterales bacterium]|nr:glycosyltransferase family 4 protein [Solirubrobacterales bacterium]